MADQLRDGGHEPPSNNSTGADGEEVASDETEVRRASPETAARARLEQRAISAVIMRHDYPIFLAEASQIGYSPSGVTIPENDLYRITGALPDPNDRTTILGQHRSFASDPASYAGSGSPQCMSLMASALFSAHPTYRMDPKFHLFERERLASPPTGMRLLRLGDVLRRREENADPAQHPDREFLVPTLTQEGGLIPREPGQGKNPPAWFGQYFTGASRWYTIHTDDLVYSQIDLWKGCVTIVPEQWDGAILTQEFPIYEVDREQLDPHYLKLVLRSKYLQRAIRAITTGHSNRRRTQSGDFEDLTIFVPDGMDVQTQVSDAVRASEQSVSEKQRRYREFLAAFDRLVVGEIRPEEIPGVNP